VGFEAAFANGLRAAGFATRVVVAVLGATLARGGRGIVASGWDDAERRMDGARSRASVVL
jgi:hypothetical protein